ncbi:ead/Ea22-like family protein, partial [bacterium]|nr:ead/Ea22-like family protein [bacterium]
HMVREMKVVKACLTEADANWFIKRKQHDYGKLYTYVYSMCYCPQMIELREWIISLTNKSE